MPEAGLFLVCGTGLCLASYFGFYVLLSRDAAAAEFVLKTNIAMSQKCRNAGELYYSASYAAINEQPVSGAEILWQPAEFHYNRKLNTCLVHIGYVLQPRGKGLSYHYNQIIDVKREPGIAGR